MYFLEAIFLVAIRKYRSICIISTYLVYKLINIRYNINKYNVYKLIYKKENNHE